MYPPRYRLVKYAGQCLSQSLTMRAVIENWILGHWYGAGQPPWYLRMLEPLYRSAYQRVAKKGRTGLNRYRSELPLIIVGNITTGGSGKTPLVIHLCQLAQKLNLKPGIITTGYGRQSRDTLVVRVDSDPHQCGDEPVLLASRTGAPVVVSEHRRDALERLSEMNLDLVISDDGLQQYDLDRDIEFCVVDGKRGLGNGHLLPAGPLRESSEALNRVNHVVSNGQWDDKPKGLDVTVMSLQAKELRSLDERTSMKAMEFRHENTGKDIHAFAGLGNPQRFFSMLANMGIKAVPHTFPDHHSYVPADFHSVPKTSIILMTEKDAVKCRRFGLKNAWYVPIETHLPAEFETLIKERMMKLTKDRKS